MLASEAAPQLVTPLHEQLAELIPPLPRHTPQNRSPQVLPSTSLASPVASSPCRQFCTRRELARQQAAHDLHAQVVPARSQHHLPAEPFGVAGSRRQADELPLSKLQRLGRGERVLDGRVDPPSKSTGLSAKLLRKKYGPVKASTTGTSGG